MKESVYKSYDDPAVVPQLGNGGKGVGRITIVRLRADARTGLPGAAHRQQDGSTQRTVHPMGE